MTEQAPRADDFWAKKLAEIGAPLVDELLRGELQRIRVALTGDSIAPPAAFPTWMHANAAGSLAAGVADEALARADLEALMALAREGAMASVLVLDLVSSDCGLEHGSPVRTLASSARLWRASALRAVCERAPRPELRLVDDVNPGGPDS